ncbi:MAG: MotA/TolQ/ExbB proton channel family protein [Bdellovibrionales bacterium]|nr:MotA/TolQ/ExbB proton channel family protein [Bdellovibrionales bacterium]
MFIIESMQNGGPLMWVILALLITISVLSAERVRALYFKMNLNKEHFFKSLTSYLLKGDLEGMLLVCDQNEAPLSKVIKSCLIRVMNNGTDQEIQASLDEAAMVETPAIEKNIGFLAVFGNLSTLCGLLGTVTGLITAFKGVADADPSTKAAMLTKGISEAMLTTAFGLVAAIPAVFSYAFLQSRAQRLIDDINEISIRTLNFIVANRERFGVEEAGEEEGEAA